MWVQSLDPEETLGEGMTTHSSIVAWRIPWTEQPGRPQSIGLQTVGHNRSDLTHMHHYDCHILSSMYVCICHLSIYPCIQPPTICLCTYLSFNYLSTYLSTHPPICLSIQSLIRYLPFLSLIDASIQCNRSRQH